MSPEDQWLPVAMCWNIFKEKINDGMIPAPGKKIYFISDFHLGAPNYTQSLQRERKVVEFLHTIEEEVDSVFILGDIFDFWFEYKQVVPKGYTRLLGRLAEMSDRGIPIHVFTGNHDLWMRGYFENELRIRVYQEPRVFEWGGKKFFIGHGDGLGPGDKGYKRLKKIFRNPVCQWMFRQLHPDLSIGLAQYFSRSSREATGNSDQHFLGAENEWLIQYCYRKLQEQSIDYFIFGHRHLPIDFSLNDKSRYINTGDWIRHFSYAVYNGETLQLVVPTAH
jgi:UDP-2,3-diacylglucosamine hydrolase